MSLHLYNTLTHQKEEFVPLETGEVSIYNCGPTVYDSAHLGNFRTFVMNDIIRRVFEYENYKVTQVMNITDVDDKTIKRSVEENKSLEELTRHYETLFFSDIHALNILTPHKVLRASEHISEMVTMISNLIEKKVAYPAKDGIYFSIEKFKGYGKLAGINLNNEVRERISNDEYDKESPRDFALWKFHSKDDGEVAWEATFGKGRPGWHIECSAMSNFALGSTIDIHSGGIDLIFPHHTNEIAQSESASGKTFAKYWVHGAFMNVNEDKMAKSKGNFLKLKDIENNGISSLAFRYWLLTSHYRSPINFTEEAVKGAQNAFIRLVETFIRLGEVENEHIHSSAHPTDYRKEFLDKINNDFDMPGTLALTWDLIKDPTVSAKEKVTLMLDFDNIFGFGLKAVAKMKEEIPSEIIALAEAREESRENKEWDKADALRIEIESRGYLIKDNESSYKLSKK